MRHESEFMPNNSAVVRFTVLHDPMHGVCRNKETFSVGLLEDTHSVKIVAA